MDAFSIAAQGVVVSGHGPRGEARTEAAQCLIVDHGWTPVDADDATDDASVSRAWWAGDEVGFVSAEYPGAVPVTVLNIPNAP